MGRAKPQQVQPTHQFAEAITVPTQGDTDQTDAAKQVQDQLRSRQSVDLQQAEYNWFSVSRNVHFRVAPQSSAGLKNPVMPLKTLTTTGLKCAFSAVNRWMLRIHHEGVTQAFSAKLKLHQAVVYCDAPSAQGERGEHFTRTSPDSAKLLTRASHGGSPAML